MPVECIHIITTLYPRVGQELRSKGYFKGRMKVGGSGFSRASCSLVDGFGKWTELELTAPPATAYLYVYSHWIYE